MHVINCTELCSVFGGRCIKPPKVKNILSAIAWHSNLIRFRCIDCNLNVAFHFTPYFVARFFSHLRSLEKEIYLLECVEWVHEFFGSFSCEKWARYMC